MACASRAIAGRGRFWCNFWMDVDDWSRLLPSGQSRDCSEVTLRFAYEEAGVSRPKLKGYSWFTWKLLTLELQSSSSKYVLDFTDGNR